MRSFHFGEFTLFDIVLSYFPVDSCYIVVVVFRSFYFQKSISFLSVVSGEKYPSVRFSFTRVSQVVVESWHKHLELKVHLTCFRIDFYERDYPFEFSFVILDGYVFLWNRHREASSPYDILSVFSNESRRVVTSSVRKLQGFFCFESFEVNTRYTRCVVRVDEDPAPVHFSIGLRKVRVVGVIPRNEPVGSLQKRFGFFVVTIRLFWVL